jgi:hypothetical protein
MACSRDMPELAAFLQRRNSFRLMTYVLRSIIRGIAHSNLQYLSAIVDEATDASAKEQVSVCLRSPSNDLEPAEEFVGLYQTASASGATISDITVMRGFCEVCAANFRAAWPILGWRLLFVWFCERV